ncbi:MAG: hypothetical protein QE279_11680 [Rhodoferax sp.]|nr:hypothetical protein [Rhodoferax sp.]
MAWLLRDGSCSGGDSPGLALRQVNIFHGGGVLRPCIKVTVKELS